MNKEFKILTSQEEKELNSSELKNYYENLRKYLLSTKHSDNLSKGSLTLCKYLNPLVRNGITKFASFMSKNEEVKEKLTLKQSISLKLKSKLATIEDLPKYEIIVDGADKVKDLVGIYAHTHQSKDDHLHYAVTNPNHTIILNSAVMSEKYKMAVDGNGAVYVDKDSKESKNNAKLELIRLLLNGKSITVFPESAWNLSPNKLHLPLYLGIVDIAKKANVPIIPVLQEYTYDEEILDGKERIKRVYIKYGEPIYVKENDDLVDKLNEYSEQISTMRWEFLRKNGVYKRSDISNRLYTNHIRGCIRNLENAEIDVNVEKSGIYGANNDFYLFHHLNAVDFDANDNLLPTEHVRSLQKINRMKLKK